MKINSYFVASTVVNVSLFAFFIRSPLILCLLCVLALFATVINVKILVNILFAAEISYSVLYLGFPARIANLPGDYSCHVFSGAFAVVAVQK